MSINPVEFYKKQGWYVTSPYGPRTGIYAGHHNGVDFGGHPCGADIPTPYSGVVKLATGKGMGTWGNTVVIEIAPGLLQLTSHHKTIRCKVGDTVNSGDIIATNGGTNNTSKPYSCHIHYEIRIDDGTRVVGSRPWGDPGAFWLDQTPKENSTRFAVGDYIISGLSDANVNVRETPGGRIIDKIEPGEGVRVVGAENNGRWVGNYYWWKTTKGWVAEAFFGVLLAPDPEPIVPPELPVDNEELMGCLKKLYLLLKELFEK